MDSNGYEYNTEDNSDGLISAFVNPDGSNTQISYDDEGRIRSIMNPDGSEVTFAYDSNDRVVRNAVV
ncbi:MAG: RHS repeat protein, partial [Proteobacteria bacterium]|nr:RHS repeat protein [Pseudomonadota bacterium]